MSLPCRRPEPSGDVQLATFPRGPGERLALTFREYEGFHFLDIRIQFEKDGVWLPTKRGLTIKLRELWNFSDAVAKALELAGQVSK